jgi:hypothetical protein
MSRRIRPFVERQILGTLPDAAASLPGHSAIAAMWNWLIRDFLCLALSCSRGLRAPSGVQVVGIDRGRD